MLRFRPKPVIVEAVQWTGDDQTWAAICAGRIRRTASVGDPHTAEFSISRPVTSR